jgi:hypothetical protein
MNRNNKKKDCSIIIINVLSLFIFSTETKTTKYVIKIREKSYQSARCRDRGNSKLYRKQRHLTIGKPTSSQLSLGINTVP